MGSEVRFCFVIALEDCNQGHYSFPAAVFAEGWYHSASGFSLSFESLENGDETSSLLPTFHDGQCDCLSLACDQSSWHFLPSGTPFFYGGDCAS